jgi:hypothetical protein
MPEDGMHAIAFTFKDILDEFGKEITEVAMDSTCKISHPRTSKVILITLCTGKTNVLGYELFAIIGEANGQAIPFAWIFTTSTDGTALPKLKEHILREVLGYLAKRCPNVKLMLSDKDTDEVVAMQGSWIKAKKHQYVTGMLSLMSRNSLPRTNPQQSMTLGRLMLSSASLTLLGPQV